MSDIGSTDAAGIAPPPQPRQVFTPRASLQRRTGLLVLGVVLVLITGFAFWLVLQSVDTRQDYLVASRDIQRWKVIDGRDLDIVQANVGDAAGLRSTSKNIQDVRGQWALGDIPAGTILTAGMFGPPPLASEDDSGKVLIEVSLPQSEAPDGYLEAGERIALIGAESLGENQASFPGLIGVLELRDVFEDGIFYTVTPEEAIKIERIIGRYSSASERRIWKLNDDVTTEQLISVLGESGALPPLADRDFPDDSFSSNGLPDPEPGSEPLENPAQ